MLERSRTVVISTITCLAFSLALPHVSRAFTAAQAPAADLIQPHAVRQAWTGMATYDATVTSDHFKVLYRISGAGAIGQQQANQMLGDLEFSWQKLIAGGGGSPNAGLAAPASTSGDSKIDVYVIDSASSTGCPATRACTYIGPGAQYMLMRSTDTSLRTLSHEFTHIIQGGYDIRVPGSGTAMAEAVASWGSYWVLPGGASDAGWLWPQQGESLDCHNREPVDIYPFCPYDGWLFIERQAEDYGASWIDALMRRTETTGPAALQAALSAASPTASLSSRYQSFARQLWQPSTWSGWVPAAVATSVQGSSTLHYNPDGQVAQLAISRAAADSGDRQTDDVDYLSARYVKLTEDAGAISGDRLRVSVTSPSGVSAASVIVEQAGGGAQEIALSDTCGTEPCATVAFDPSVSAIVLVLANDSASTPREDLSFGWRAQLIPAPPLTAPVNTAPPTIAGPAAVGDHVRCSPGSWSVSGAIFYYGWLRDGAPIIGQDANSYQVAAADARHGLSCRVTAVNWAGRGVAASARLTVAGKQSDGQGTPDQGNWHAVVGRARAAGARVIATVFCAGPPMAVCRVSGELSATETLRGHKLVAVGATAHLDRRTVSLGSASMTVSAAQSRHLVVSLNAAGKRLVEIRRLLRVRLTVRRRTPAGKPRAVASVTVTLRAGKR